MIQLIEYSPEYQDKVNCFFEDCLPETGRVYEPNGRHKKLRDIHHTFLKFWILAEDGQVIGTAGICALPDPDRCELKCLYLYRSYQGQGYGKWLLETAMDYARSQGHYRYLYLDTIKSSERAVALYRKKGFVQVERYNDNIYADMFMCCEL